MSAAILGAGDPVINNIKVKIFPIVKNSYLMWQETSRLTNNYNMFCVMEIHIIPKIGKNVILKD